MFHGLPSNTVKKGLAQATGSMKTPITLWEVSGNAIYPTFIKKLILGQYREEKKKTINNNNEEVTSFSQFVINEKIEIKEKNYRIELGHSEEFRPSLSAFEPISVQGSPRMQDIKAGEISKEWTIYV